MKQQVCVYPMTGKQGIFMSCAFCMRHIIH